MITALEHLALIWAGVFVAIIAARKTRLTPVLYFLAVGSIAVNLGWLPESPEPLIQGLAEIGIIVIMFALGFEEDNSNFLSSLKKSWGIAFFGALVPFLVAFFIAEHFWSDRNLSLMVGLTMTATAVSLTMVSLKSEGLGKSVVATRIMTSAVIDDIASLALVAILVPIATGQSTPELAGIVLVAGKAISFFLLVTVLGAFVFPRHRGGWFSKIPLMGQRGMRDLLSIGNGEYATLTVLLLALTVGIAAHLLGFHPAVGAYMAGLVLKEEYFENPDSNSFIQTRRIVDDVAFTWMGPIFFVILGSQIIFDWEILRSVLPQTAMLFFGVFFGQIASASIAARFTGDMNWSGSLMIGFGMLGRAELAFVVMNIAYVQHAIINTEAFYMLMLAIFFLNLAVPLTIRAWKPHYQRSIKEDC